MTVRIEKTIAFELDPDEIAEAFCEYGNEEQAHIINLIGTIFQSWDNPAAGIMQAFYVSDSENLTPEGVWFIENMANSLKNKPFREGANIRDQVEEWRDEAKAKALSSERASKRLRDPMHCMALEHNAEERMCQKVLKLIDGEESSDV